MAFSQRFCDTVTQDNLVSLGVADNVCDNGLVCSSSPRMSSRSLLATFCYRDISMSIIISVMISYITLHSSPKTSLATSSSGPSPSSACTPRPLFPGCTPAAREAISRAESCASIERYQTNRVSTTGHMEEKRKEQSATARYHYRENKQESQLQSNAQLPTPPLRETC